MLPYDQYPMQAHPAYADIANLIRQQMLFKQNSTIQVVRLTKRFKTLYQENTSTTEVPTITFALKIRRVRGLAPFVGKPFDYEWLVATDRLGRSVSSEAQIIDRPLLP